MSAAPGPFLTTTQFREEYLPPNVGKRRLYAIADKIGVRMGRSVYIPRAVAQKFADGTLEGFELAPTPRKQK